MDNQKIMIGVPTADIARYANFYDYFNVMEKPEGTIISMVHGQSPARNRNIIIRQAIEHNCTHIFFLDDDVAFKPDTLYRLLAHDKDIVTGLYLMRSYPHTPIIFDYADEQGRCRTHFLSNNESGLIEIVAAGLGCCLIKIDVFKAIEDPWVTLGELERDHWCDDLSFFQRVRETGKFKLYCDLDVLVGHMGQLTIWPNKLEGKWVSTYDTRGKGTASVLQIKE